MIKAIIFDFFGVIGQSTLGLMRQHFNLSPQQVVELNNAHKLLDYEYIGSRKYLEAYADVLGISYEEVYRIYEDSKSRFSKSDEILNYVSELKKSYKVALLTNVSHLAFHEFIGPIEDIFDVVVTSFENKVAKPERAIYELCAQKLGVDISECVMIDDSHLNCEGARTAGMEAIQFEDFNQLKQELTNLLADSDD